MFNIKVINMPFLGMLFVTTIISSQFCLQRFISCHATLYIILVFFPERAIFRHAFCNNNHQFTVLSPVLH